MHAVMRTIAVINQKGGVGKTTTVANLGAAVASRGKDLCLVDLDPQGHLSLHYGIEPDENTPTAYDVLREECTVPTATQMLTPNLWLIPSTIDLAAAESELANEPGREKKLRDSFLAQSLPHDFVLIDCPPSLGLLTLNALALADDVIIPLQPHFLALQGLGKLLETIDLVHNHINPKIRVAGVVLCMFESVTRLAAEVVADLREFFAASRDTGKPWSEARIFRTVIRRNIKLAECPSYGKTIFEYEPKSHGAKDYQHLAEEFIRFFIELENPHTYEPEQETYRPIPTAVPPPYCPPLAILPKPTEPGHDDQPPSSAEPQT